MMRTGLLHIPGIILAVSLVSSSFWVCSRTVLAIRNPDIDPLGVGKLYGLAKCYDDFETGHHDPSSRLPDALIYYTC